MIARNVHTTALLKGQRVAKRNNRFVPKYLAVVALCGGGIGLVAAGGIWTYLVQTSPYLAASGIGGGGESVVIGMLMIAAGWFASR